MSDCCDKTERDVAARYTSLEDICESRWKEIQALTLERDTARAECHDLNDLFELQLRADQRAVKRWREAHPGKEMTSPDRADLVVWLMGQLDEARAEGERLRGERVVLLDNLLFKLAGPATILSWLAAGNDVDGDAVMWSDVERIIAAAKGE